MSIVYVDEVGMSSIFSCLACCCVVGNNKQIKGVKDSKKLTKKKRSILYPILQKEFVHAFGYASPNKIQTKNVFWARNDAMRMAVLKLVKKGVKVDKVIIDGKHKLQNLDIEQESVIKGDDRIFELGVASVLAKVKRDNMLKELSKIEKYSYYDLQNNAGYYTKKHRRGIILYGPTELHRKNFAFFRYSLYCHNKYKEFLSQGKTVEDYFQYEEDQEKIAGKSFYALWKNGAEDLWKEIPYGQGG